MRVHPDPEFVFDIDGAEYARDLYYVDRDMVQELRSRFIKVNEYRLYCCIQRDLDGNLSHRVMPVRLQTPAVVTPIGGRPCTRQRNFVAEVGGGL